MKKICIVYNFAAKYREGIFMLIDRELECDWFFGNNHTDIKGFDIERLKSAKTIKNKFLYHNFYWQKGVPKLIFNTKYDRYILLGDLFCLSTWASLICNKIFKKKKKIFLWTHGWYGKESRIRRFLKKFFFKMADGVLLYGNYAKQLMIREGFNPEKLFVIHNSLDYDSQLAIRNSLTKTDIFKNKFGNDNPVLIFIGRLTEGKKLHLLIKATAKLRAEGKMFNLVLVGDGGAKKSLQDLATELGLIHNTWFYGESYNDIENGPLLYNADICVSPGNVGLTAMHALMFGTPVITHNNFSLQMPEFESVIENKTGAFFTEDSIDSLASTINQWFANKQYYRERIREYCYKEIDTKWTPYFQFEIIKKAINV